MEANRFRRGDITGVRTLIFLQSILCMILGASLVVAPLSTLSAVMVLLGGYWLLRGLATVGHAFAEPTRWAGKGAVAVLNIVGGLLVLQAPLLGVFSLGLSIILFLGAQAVISGGIEVVAGLRSHKPPLSVLGLVNIILGGVILMHLVVPMTILPLSLGLVALVGGMLAGYAAIKLPVPEGMNTRWYAGGEV